MKKINLKLEYINNEKISKYKYQNTSVKEMHLDITKKNKDDITLLYLQNIFPNLTDLFLQIYGFGDEQPITSISKIINNSNCHIRNLKIQLYQSHSFQIYCQALETLESIDFYISAK